MRHLEEATVLGIRDGAPVDQEAQQHLEGCAVCGAALAEASARAEAIARTLTALDGPVEATAAKAGVRARLAATGGEGTRRRWGTRHLGRAAALVVVTAGAAAALQWSPLRNLSRVSPAVDEATQPATAQSVESTAQTATDDAEAVGIAVGVTDGVVQVVVRGAAAGTDIEVTWVEEPTARLSAPAGSRFTYSSGRVEVDASRGPIQVELPRSASLVSVEVDGRLYLNGTAGSPEVLGPAVETSEQSIRFRVVDP